VGRGAIHHHGGAVVRGARPYDDAEGPDGLHRYKLRRDANGRSENHSLRVAMDRNVPLIWFYGLVPGEFQVILPVYLVAEEADQDQFVLAVTADQRSMIEQRTVIPGSPVESTLRRYLIGETRRRLHQPVFASQVMIAYATACAVCALAHRELLDAAHIIPDSAPGGDPVVPNGLALCKIHHAAYDANVLGIRPDCTVEIHQRLLDEIDGPMLRHGLQERPRPHPDAGPVASRGPTGRRPPRTTLRGLPRRLTARAPAQDLGRRQWPASRARRGVANRWPPIKPRAWASSSLGPVGRARRARSSWAAREPVRAGVRSLTASW